MSKAPLSLQLKDIFKESKRQHKSLFNWSILNKFPLITAANLIVREKFDLKFLMCCFFANSTVIFVIFQGYDLSEKADGQLYCENFGVGFLEISFFGSWEARNDYFRFSLRSRHQISW